MFSSWLRKVKPGDYQEVTDCLHNPGCGWYQIYTYDAGVPFRPEEMAIMDGDRLAMVRIDLGRFREVALPERCLTNIQDILQAFHGNGTDIILRAAYDFEGKGLQREPDLFRQVQEHLRQLAPLIREFEDRILVFQGLLVGSWGEMHQSKFLSGERLRGLEEAFRSAGNEKVWLALRRPMFLRMLVPEGTPFGRRTLFDDAIGASETDMGTFGRESRRQAAWEQAWSREDELAFMEKACAGAPFGGEAVLPVEGYAQSPSEVIKTLGRMHLSYLNCQHDGQMLERWRRETLRQRGVWNGGSLYDYIGAHMGYRFCVRRASISKTAPDGGGILTVEIENTGFGNLPQEAQVELVRVDETGRQYRQPLDWDPRTWRSGERTVCTARVQIPVGRAYLRVYRKWDGCRILFATKTGGDPVGGQENGEYVPIC